MKKAIKTIKNYWYLWLSIIVGIVSGTIVVFNQCGLFSISIQLQFSPIICLCTIIIGWKAIEMIHELRRGNFGIDILAIIAIIACLLNRESWAAYLICLMLSSGEALEHLASRRAKRELSALINRRPQIAHYITNDNKIIDINLSRIKVDDKLLIKPNEVVSVDGKLLSAATVMDESSLTGESLPVNKKDGDKIISGTVNIGQAIIIQATTTVVNSHYNQIIRLVKQAESQPSHFVNLANRYAIPFTIVSLIIATIGYLISGDFGRFAEVLVVASPCPLILAAPIAFVSGMSRCSSKGIIVKNGDTLEKIAKADTFAFDKTGTLTNNKIEVSHIHATTHYTKLQIISLAAAAESTSTHVLANSVLRFTKEHNIKIVEASSIREVTGGGVFATVNKNRLVVGSLDFIKSNKITGLPDNMHNQTAIILAINGKYAGAVYFADTIRHGAKATISKLRRLGIKNIIMLTGDRAATANAVAKTLKIDTAYSELKPKDKVKIVADYHNHGSYIAMIGDGVNDAPVLAAADIGIAMGVMESTVTGEVADAVITSNSISRIVDLRQISRQTITVAKQSVITGIIICLSLEIIALFGAIPAILGALLQELIDITTMINALRARK